MSNPVTMNPTVFSPTVGGKAAVTIQCSDSFGMTNDLTPAYIANIRHTDEVFFTATPEGRQIIAVFERFKASANNQMIVRQTISASTHFGFSDSQSFSLKKAVLTGNESVLIRDFISEVLGYFENVLMFDVSLAATRARQDCSDDVIANGSISSTVTLRPQAFDTIAHSDSVTTTVDLHIIEYDVLSMTNHMIDVIGTLLAGYDQFTMSQAMQYTIKIQVMEAFKAASDALPHKTTLLNPSEFIEFADNDALGMGLLAARIESLQAFDSVVMADPGWNKPSQSSQVSSQSSQVSSQVSSQFKTPYELWADGRWGAFYGNGITGTIEKVS